MCNMYKGYGLGICIHDFSRHQVDVTYILMSPELNSRAYSLRPQPVCLFVSDCLSQRKTLTLALNRKR